MDVDPLGCDADLARIREAGPEQLLGNFRNVGIGQHDRRVVPAEFQGDALQIAAGTFHDLLAGRGRTGEGNLVDIRVLGDQRAKAVLTGNDVDHSGGQRRRSARQCAAWSSGVNGEGLSTIVQPEISAGTIF